MNFTQMSQAIDDADQAQLSALLAGVITKFDIRPTQSDSVQRFLKAQALLTEVTVGDVTADTLRRCREFLGHLALTDAEGRMEGLLA